MSSDTQIANRTKDVINYLQSLWGITILGLLWFETEFPLCALGSIGSLTHLILDTKKVT